MICTLDENGYCARHQRIHQEPELTFALLEGEEGERHRRLWDWQVSPDRQKFRDELIASRPAPPPAQPQTTLPCGDLVEKIAKRVKIDRVMAWLKKKYDFDCGCLQRKMRMNQACADLEKWLRRLAWLKPW